MRLPISEEKSKVTNLKKEASEFFGFEIRMKKNVIQKVARENKYTVEGRSHEGFHSIS